MKTATLGQVFKNSKAQGFDYFAFVGTYDGTGQSIGLAEGWFTADEESAKKHADEVFRNNNLPGTIVGVIRRGDDLPAWTMHTDGETIAVSFPQEEATK